MRLGTLIECWRTLERKSVRKAASDIGIDHTALFRFERGQAVESTTLAKILNWSMGSAFEKARKAR